MQWLTQNPLELWVFTVSPLLGMMQQLSTLRTTTTDTSPPPTQGTNLEAAGNRMVNQARRAAMRGEETSMTGHFYNHQYKTAMSNLNFGEGYIMNSDKTSVDDQMGQQTYTVKV